MCKYYFLIVFYEKSIALFGKKICICEKKAVPLRSILNGSVHRCGKFLSLLLNMTSKGQAHTYAATFF